MLLGRTGDQVVARPDVAAHPVRDAARGVRGEVAALERDDLQLVRPLEPAGLGRGGHARRVPADDHQSLRCHAGLLPSDQRAPRYGAGAVRRPPHPRCRRPTAPEAKRPYDGPPGAREHPPDHHAQRRGEQERERRPERHRDPPQHRHERVPAAAQRVQEPGVVVLLLPVVARGVRRRQVQGDRRQRGAVLQARLLGQQRLQIGLAAAQLALQGDHVADPLRLVHQLAHPRHTRPLGGDPALHVDHLVGDVLRIRGARQQLPGPGQLPQHLPEPLLRHPQHQVRRLPRVVEPLGVLRRHQTARPLRGGARGGHGLRHALRLDGERGRTDDVAPPSSAPSSPTPCRPPATRWRRRPPRPRPARPRTPRAKRPSRPPPSPRCPTRRPTPRSRRRRAGGRRSGDEHRAPPDEGPIDSAVHAHNTSPQDLG
ncbi:hypothetical protein SCALM49S_02393 [Streptomyces californicus]